MALKSNHNLSYWESKYYAESVDIAIIGAGYVGLAAAYHLKVKFPNKHIHVFERNSIPAGASTKNAGFACFGSASEILSDIEQGDEERVFDLVTKRWQGLKLTRALLGEQNIEYQSIGGYELFRYSDEQLYLKCLNKLEYLNEKLLAIVGQNVFEARDYLIEHLGFNNVEHLIFNKYEGVLNPMLMLDRLKQLCLDKGVFLHYGFEVQELSDSGQSCHLFFSNGLDIKSEKVVIATNGFAKDLIDIPVRPARAQVIITKPISNLKISGAFHFCEGYYYFRNIDGRVLFGGGRNLDFSGEETDQMENTNQITSHLLELLTHTILPDQSFEIEQKWSGIMGIGNEKSPIIKKENNIYLTVRLGGMGVAIGLETGRELSEIIEF